MTIRKRQTSFGGTLQPLKHPSRRVQNANNGTDDLCMTLNDARCLSLARGNFTKNIISPLLGYTDKSLKDLSL